jgi:hypothetical protein
MSDYRLGILPVFTGDFEISWRDPSMNEMERICIPWGCIWPDLGKHRFSRSRDPNLSLNQAGQPSTLA